MHLGATPVFVDTGLPGRRFMPAAEYGRSTRWLTCVTLEGEPSVKVPRQPVRGRYLPAWLLRKILFELTGGKPCSGTYGGALEDGAGKK